MGFYWFYWHWFTFSCLGEKLWCYMKGLLPVVCENNNTLIVASVRSMLFSIRCILNFNTQSSATGVAPSVTGTTRTHTLTSLYLLSMDPCVFIDPCPGIDVYGSLRVAAIIMSWPWHCGCFFKLSRGCCGISDSLHSPK